MSASGPDPSEQDRESNDTFDPLDLASASIADGTPVPWHAASSSSDAASLGALQEISRIAAFSRDLQRDSPDRADPLIQETGQPVPWGHLTLLECVGMGASGAVWRAWDPTLQREVALKFLLPRPEESGDAESSALLREARALARVSHPHVVAVHGIALHDGRPGMWMEHLRGRTLAEEIERRAPLPATEVLRIALQLCSALEAIHGADLIHRDLKPANIVLESESRAVVTDFGLGWRPALSAAGDHFSSGTPFFMAPELLAGGLPTVRSDLYALGVTLWWALAGRPPFHARSFQELQVEAKSAPSPSLRELRPDAPRELVEAIERSMDPEPSNRPAGAARMADLLRRAEPKLARSPVRGTQARRLLGSLAVVVALVLAVGLFIGRDDMARLIESFRSKGTPSVAVLPFVNSTGNSGEDYYADGMTEELIARLAMVEGLRVISRSSVMTFKHTSEPLPKVAAKLGVGMVLEGSVAHSQGSVRVSTRLVDVRTGHAVWAHVYERESRDVLAIQSEIASEVVRMLQARITPDERQRIVRVRERTPKAHAAYLQGLATYRLLTPDGMRRAVRLYEQALAIDSTYSDAWEGLALAYDMGAAQHVWGLKDGRARALSAATKALVWNPESGVARALIATLQSYEDLDFGAAERSYREALAKSPGNADIRIELAIKLVGMTRFEEAAIEAARARELDPLSSFAAAVSLFPLFEGRRFSDAARSAKEIQATHPSPNVEVILGQSLLFSGEEQEAITTLLRAASEMPTFPYFHAWLGIAYARTGRMDEARSRLGVLHELRRTQDVDPYLFAIVHAWLEEREQALDYLASAVEGRGGELLFFLVDPALDPLRKEPRFLEMVRSLGLDRWGRGDRIYTWEPDR